jgi:chromosome partitioning protein
MIVLVGGEKGGVGKTTLAVNLAAMRSRAGHDVLLIDADRQGSANLWAGIRQEDNRARPVPCVQKRGKGLAADIRDLAARYEDVVIDAGGQDSVELRAALTIAELAIFPIQPSLFDAATLETLAELVTQAQGFNSDLVAAVVINRASTNPRVKEADDAKDLIAAYSDLHLLEALLRDRIVFRKTARDGLCVLEADHRDPAAEAEMNALYREVFGDG